MRNEGIGKIRRKAEGGRKKFGGGQKARGGRKKFC